MPKRIISRKPVFDRFMQYVSPEPMSGCWLWIGSMHGNDYGCFKALGTTQAHRFGYILLIGPIPEGLDLDHKCRVRCCVNPKHLEPVTRKENLARGLGGRLRTKCPSGHYYSPENTRIRVDPSGWESRVCITCEKDRHRLNYVPRGKNPWYEKQKAITHCPKGHEYTSENTAVYDGCRHCKACAKIRDQERKRIKREQRQSESSSAGFELGV